MVFGFGRGFGAASLRDDRILVVFKALKSSG